MNLFLFVCSLFFLECKQLQTPVSSKKENKEREEEKKRKEKTRFFF